MDSIATILSSVTSLQSDLARSCSVGFAESSVSARANYEYRITEREHLQRMRQIARKQTQGTRVDWQDAVQTAQLKLITAMRAGKFNCGSEADFDRWATMVAKCEIIDLVRKSQYRDWESIDRLFGESHTLLDTLADPIDTMTLLERQDSIDRIDRAVRHLDRLFPDRHYYRLWECKVNDKTQIAIATELGISQGAVSKRWRELLAKLMLELGLESHSSIDLTPSQQQW